MDDPEYADLTRVDPWHLPLVGHGRGGGGSGACFRDTIDRAADQAWWRERSLRHLLADVRVPVLTWSGWYDRNPNTGGDYGHAAEPVVAQQAIHHAPARASHVLLPVVPRPA